jgi:pimeloyl-ACP methyl ester carboxylesterase
MLQSLPQEGGIHRKETTMSSSSTHLPTPEGPGAGHWLPEQAPEEMLAALGEFLAPYRESRGGLR